MYRHSVFISTRNWNSLGGTACGVVKLKTVLCLVNIATIHNIKYLIPSSGYWTHNHESLDWGQSCSAVSRSVTVKPTGCGFDPHSRRWNIYLNLYFRFFALVSRLSAALSSATQHAMPPEFGRKWGTECLNTRFPLPTLRCAGYRVKLIFFFW